MPFPINLVRWVMNLTYLNIVSHGAYFQVHSSDFEVRSIIHINKVVYFYQILTLVSITFSTVCPIVRTYF
jgi:hypothetical protein